MKRLGTSLALICIFLVMSVGAFAEGNEPLPMGGKGTVQTGHPPSFVIGVTEAEFRVNRCSVKLASQGVDALVAEIGSPTYFSVRANLLGMSQPASLTGMYSNQSFYSSDCTWIWTAYMRPNKSLTIVPPGARWVVVAFPYGSKISVEWKACLTTTDCAYGY